MMRRLVLVIFCLLIQGTSLCYGQQTIYIYIVPPISAGQTVQVYAKKNTKVKWVVITNGDSFQIQFPTSTPPCKFTDAAHLTATYDHPAECKITLPKKYKTGSVLHFQYSIIPSKRHDDNPIMFYQHVGSCDPCSDPGQVVGPVAPGSNTAVTTTSTPAAFPVPHTVILSCTESGTPPQASPDPLPVNIGDTIFWQNPNGGNSKFTITFADNTICDNPTPSESPTCVVKATPSKSYTYNVVVGNEQSPKCKFDGSLVAPKP